MHSNSYFIILRLRSLNMLNLPDYNLIKELSKGNERIYYTGEREQDGSPVIIKTHLPNIGSLDAHNQLKHEYELLQSIKGNGIPKACGLITHVNGLALVMEYVDGILLSEYMDCEEIDLRIFLKIAISAANVLNTLHQQNITHNDIQPDNLFIDKRTKEIWVVDFRFASVLQKEKPKIVNLHISEESLRYMSPEYTGRMNRDIDYRTDLYSLGVLFYKMLTRRFPFESSDPIELVHSHLAKQPETPNEIDSEIPDVISRIIMKLLSKNAEDRYLSLRGLIGDFKKCQLQLENRLRIEKFDLGEEDFAEKFRISQQLYGRDKEIKKLLDLFERAGQEKISMAVISGNPGVGKSSLVHEVYKLAINKRGFFITGKFDQYHQNIPYSALGHAFQNLVRHLLAESEESLMNWRERLLSVLGTYGQIIIDVIPDMELIVGPQPGVKKLDAPESKNRFNRLMMDFIRVFCDPEHPLAIFLDDLQWVDTATLKLVENLMTDVKMRNLLLVISYRDNEVSGEHPLSLSIKEMARSDCEICHISLGPLDANHTTRLIADTLNTKQRPITPLVELVMQKTGGNPFFVKQFLTLLYQDSLIYFNAQHGCWEWKLSEIKSLDITNNVVELLLRSLERMPPETQNILMMGACIGSSFRLETLQTITNYTEDEIIRHLLPAIQQDLVLTASDFHSGKLEKTNYKFNALIHETFNFRHDRIRQASYALIDEKNRIPVHLKIGWLIYENLSGDQLAEESVYEVLHHLNMATRLIVDQQEKDEVAELNLIAGIKAKESSAFEPAFAYFSSGIKLLDQNSWDRHYHLSLRLYEECAEAALLCGIVNDAKKLIEIVLRNARTIFDRLGVFLIRIRALISSGHRKEALVMAHKILQEFGMNLPEHPTHGDAQSILINTIKELSSRPIEDLGNLKSIKTPLHLAEMKIIESIVGPAYQVSPEWFIILVCQQVRLSVKYGNTANSAIAYIFFGVIVCGYTDDIDMGYRFGQLGLEMHRRFDVKELEAKVYTPYYGGIHHWKNNLEETLNFLKAGYNCGLETGDFEYAGYNMAIYCWNLLLTGRPIEDIKSEMFYYMNAVNKIKQSPSAVYISIFLQIALNLQGKDAFPCSLSGDVYDEKTMLPLHHASDDNGAILFINLFKMMLCYLFEEHDQAVEHADRAFEVVLLLPGISTIPFYHFLDSLCRLAVYAKVSEDEQNHIIAKVMGNQSKLKKWMEHAPMNYGHKFHLVEAELARIKRNHNDALKHYAAAVRQARDSKYIHEEALANELAAKFCIEEKHDDLAGLFLERAYACYMRWGAFRKVDQLLCTFPQLKSLPLYNGEAAGHKLHSSDSGEGGFDLAALMKASQTISSEIVMDNFLQTMMKIVIENAGAERGLLILPIDRRLHVLAKGVADADGVIVQTYDTGASEAEQLPASIMNYVIRTREYVVINDPYNEARFKNDPYLQTSHPKSVLCLPVMSKSKMIGILYLENRLATDIFSSDRIEVLNLLSSQIAVSFENTRLFEELKSAEEKYRSIFENAIEGVFQTNPDGKFINANPAMAQILGYDSPEELCRKITDIEKQLYESPEDRKKFIDKLVKNGKVADLEVPFYRKDGTPIWVSLNGRGHFDENGRLKLIEGFIVDITERKAIIDAVRQTAKKLRKENILLRSNIKGRYKFGRIIGKSPQMQEVYDLILKAATTDAPVIIYGESGTGKELVARAIHDLSDRKNGNFVPVNCGAIPENLLESEFFGYKKGAFTGAYVDKKGYLDQAHEGSLFLDELGEIRLNFQVKLLRVLEDGSFTPLGDQVSKNSNARVISATGRDLQKAIQNGMMREDFYYRIHIIPIYLPPLRDRKEDIPLLLEHYLKIHSHSEKVPPVTGSMTDALVNHHWPGNVRELRNVIDRYCTLGKLDFLSPGSKPASNQEKDPQEIAAGCLGQDYQSVIEQTEKQLIIKSLESFNGNRTKAASRLGIPRRSFYRKLKKYQLI